MYNNNNVIHRGRKGIVPWTKDMDIELAETILECLATGKTAKDGAEAIANKYGNTMEACRSRWQQSLKALYANQVEAIRQKRMYGYRMDAQAATEQPVTKSEPAAPMPEKVPDKTFYVTVPLEQPEENPISSLSDMLNAIERKDKAQQERIQELELAYKHLERKYRELSGDQEAMMRLLDKARKLTVEEESPIDKPKFKLIDGVMERVK